MNRNVVCKSASTKSPELLAKYADSLLRKSAKSAEEADLENKLTQIVSLFSSLFNFLLLTQAKMTVFKYVEDKDVFQKFYSRMLAKRLVNFTSASDDAETSMIGKLKEACGFEYTNKLQRMFQDMHTSKDLNDAYKEWAKTNSGDTDNSVDFSVQVNTCSRQNQEAILTFLAGFRHIILAPQPSQYTIQHTRSHY